MSYEPASNRPTDKVNLVSDPEQWVEYYTRLNWGDRKAFRGTAAGVADGGDTLTVSVDVALARLIKDWSLTDKDGNKLPVVQSSFDLLENDDLDKIAGALAEVTAPEPADGEGGTGEPDPKESSPPTSTSPSIPQTETTPSPSDS